MSLICIRGNCFHSSRGWRIGWRDWNWKKDVKKGKEEGGKEEGGKEEGGKKGGRKKRREEEKEKKRPRRIIMQLYGCRRI